MSTDDDREQWAVVPDSGGHLWASDAGQIATLKDGGGFDVLPQRTNQFGEQLVQFRAEGKKTKVKRFVGAMILAAFGKKRPGSRRVGFRDGNSGNCRLENLAWMRHGDAAVVDLVKRKCLGKNCGVDFMSEGPGNRLCPVCTNRVGNITLSGLEGTEESSALPDEPLLGGGHH